MPFGGRAPPGPVGELNAPAIRGLTSKGREGKGRGGTVATSMQNVFHAILMTKQLVCTEVCYNSATQLPNLVFHFLKNS